MSQTSKIDLTYLNKIERFNFTVLNRLNSSPVFRKILTTIGATIGKTWVELFIEGAVVAHGFKNFKKIDPKRAVLLVPNHRTFFDQFAIAARLFKIYGRHHNIYFPVRANYFYDRISGLFVNLFIANGVMYPPFVRDRKRLRWNKEATEILINLLRNPENMVGYHPEGTRNLGPDPYEFLSAKPGCGEIIYRTNPNVIPVFLEGFPDNPAHMLRCSSYRKNPRRPYVHMVMGEPIDFSEELAMEENKKTYLTIAQKAMRHIARLSKDEITIRKKYETSD